MRPDISASSPSIATGCGHAAAACMMVSMAYHGFINFLTYIQCDIALLQESDSPAAPCLPDNQPYVYDGPVNSLGRDVAFLVHNDNSVACTPVASVPDVTDIQWRLVAHGQDCPPTAIASIYAPHVGCPETERCEFWQRLFSSVQEVRATFPNIDIVIAGGSNLWLPRLSAHRGPQIGAASKLFIFSALL